MIHETAVIYPNVKIGKDVYIGANCIIGAPAEHKKYWNEEAYSVVIDDGAVIHGNVTIDAGTIRNTYIGKNVWLMKGAYIAHDSFIADDCTISAGVMLAGEVQVWNGANIGMGAMVHQRCEIPEGCMIGMGAVVTKKTKMKEGCVYVGSPAKYLRDND